MPALDFPANPVDGQSFTSNGITYYYNANISTWLTQLVNTNVGASSNTQVLFNDAGVANGTSGLVFDKGANTVSVNQLFTSGSLGVGTNAPGYKLTARTDNASQTNWIGSVNFSASGAFGAGFISTVSPTNYSYLYQSGAGDTYLLNYYPGSMAFSTNNTTRMTISANGNVGIGVTPTSRNNARLQILDGIGFPTTQVASSDANTLDDYEEGTWTPSYIGLTSGTATHTGQAGYYIKIGRQVTVWWILRAVRGTCSGSLAISGLPFPAFNGNVEYGYLSKLGSHWGGWLTAPNIIYAVNGQSYIQLWDVNTNTLSSTALDTATSCASVSQLTYLSNS